MSGPDEMNEHLHILQKAVAHDLRARRFCESIGSTVRSVYRATSRLSIETQELIDALDRAVAASAYERSRQAFMLELEREDVERRRTDRSFTNQDSMSR